MPDREFTLAELADLVGVQPRTIRSYIEQGLLRGPENAGRGAYYTGYHFDRLRAIRVLKDVRGLTLAEVRTRLLTMPASEVALLARETEVANEPVELHRAVSALDYLRGLRGAAAPVPPQPAAPNETPMDVLLTRLDQLSRGPKPPRRAKGEVWTSVAVTPDLELRVRGAQTGDALARWERIADHLREILMSGLTEEEK